MAVRRLSSLLTEKKKAVNRRVVSKFIIASINSPSFNRSIFCTVADIFLYRGVPYPRKPSSTQSGRKKRSDQRFQALPDRLPLGLG